MESGMSFGVALVLMCGVWGVVWWYGSALSSLFTPLNRVFRPVTKVLDAADTHAQVWGAEIKASAIRKAAKIEVNKDEFEKAKSNLDLINSFDLDPTIIPEE